MTRKWRYYTGAAILSGFLLIGHGAPPAPVLAGLAGVAFFMWRRPSHLS